MKYLLKSVVTNNRDFKSGIIFIIEERYYLFGCPDGFQRAAALQKLRFNKFNAVFLPSLHSDFYAGLPGFLLTKRETQGAAKVDLLRIVAQRGIKQRIKMSASFLMPDYKKWLRVSTLPN